MMGHALSLTDWQSFYVLVGSSAAALTGLTFVVITLSAERRDLANSASQRLTGLRVFITPTAVHFAAALWLSAIMSMPGQTTLALEILLAGTGAAGLIYCLSVITPMFRRSFGYEPFLSDWIWNAVLPVLGYLALTVTGLMLPHLPVVALYAVSGAVLLLLFIGIHNAWDVVVWMTTERHAHRERERQHQNQSQSQSQSGPPR